MAALARNSRLRWLCLVALGLLALMAATNRYVGSYEAIHTLHNTDSIDYTALASAAPSLPSHSHQVVEWQAERFAVDWVVGSSAKLLGLPLETMFFFWTSVAIFALVLALADLLSHLQLSNRAAAIVLALLVLNPYMLRGFLLSPTSTEDVVLMVGLAIAARGLVLLEPVSLVGGLLLGTIARQTAVPAAIAAAAVVLIDPAWRARLGSRRWQLAAAAVVLPLACYAAIRALAAPFSGPAPSLHTMTIIGSSGSPHVLVQHFARCAIVVLGVGGLLLTLWWLSRGSGAAGGPSAPDARPEPSVLGPLALGAAVALQPAVLNPAWASYNENRLTALGLAPLVVALAMMLGRAERRGAQPIPPRLAGGAVALLVLGSFHHIYTWARLGSQAQTVVLQIAVAAGLVALTYFQLREPAATTTTAGISQASP